MGRAADLALGGWQWNTTLTIASGLPFTPSYDECNSERDTGPCRPSRGGSFHLGAGKFNSASRSVVYFNPVVHTIPDPNDPTKTKVVSDLTAEGVCSKGFCRPQLATFGNVQRNSFTGPGEIMSDMSIFKNFSFTETVKAQFQAQFFNVFNHPVYNLPGNNCIDCGGAGVINSLQGDLRMREFQVGVRFNF